MGKRLRNTVVVFIFLLCQLGCLAGCANPVIKPEPKIEKPSKEKLSNDIQSLDTYFSQFGLEIDSLSFSSVPSDSDSLSTFQCSVTASNSDFSYSAKYELTYVLFKDEWEFEDYSMVTSSIKPHNYPSNEGVEALVLAQAQAYYRDGYTYLVEVDEPITPENEPIIIYPTEIYVSNGGMYNLNRGCIFTYHFDPFSGWTPTYSFMSYDELRQYLWNSYNYKTSFDRQNDRWNDYWGIG